MENIFIFLVLLFVVAFFYASVGHGGASGYLALMALFSFQPAVMRPTALLLNLVVSAIAFFHFSRAGHFNFKIFIPLAIASLPLSFVGGMIQLNDDLYEKILGVCLLIPVIRFIFFSNPRVEETRQASFGLSLLLGACIGFLSGLIGIGGGIILSPVLILLKWTDQKQTAAISALFIFVNSLAGLAGQLITGIEFSGNMFMLTAVALAGGIAGSWLGAFALRQTVMKNILAGVLAAAAIKLLLPGS